MENNNYIKCIVLKNNLKVDIYDDVRIITLKSETDTLVIMKDYWAVVGEFNGKITLERENETVVFDDVKCFYNLIDNVFRLIMKEENYAE